MTSMVVVPISGLHPVDPQAARCQKTRSQLWERSKPWQFLQFLTVNILCVLMALGSEGLQINNIIPCPSLQLAA